MAPKLISKLPLYMLIIIVLSLILQTTARRSEMLPLPNNTTNLSPATNDIEVEPFPTNDTDTTQTTDIYYYDPLMTNDNGNTQTTDYIDPLLKNDNAAIPTTDYNDSSRPLFSLPPQYNSASWPYNAEETTATNDSFFSFATSSPPPALAPQLDLGDQNDIVLSPEIVSIASPPPQQPPTLDPVLGDQDDIVFSQEVVSIASPPPYYDQNPPTLAPQSVLGDQNDVVFSPEIASISSPLPYLDDDQNDTVDYSPLPSTTAPFNDNISPSEYLPDYKYSPNISPVYDTDYDDDYLTRYQSHPEVVPFTYEADDEVDPELVEDIQAYNDAAAQHGGSGTVVVAVGAVCLIGLGGFIYKKRKNEMQKKSQYEYLNNKRDIDY